MKTEASRAMRNKRRRRLTILWITAMLLVLIIFILILLQSDIVPLFNQRTSSPSPSVMSSASPIVSPKTSASAMPIPLPEPTQSMVVYADPSPTQVVINGVAYKDELVDIRRIIPGVRVQMIYATKDNFAGKAFYPNDLCLLQMDTALKLLQVQNLLKADGYSLIIYDAYRPFSITVEMFNSISGSMRRYFANPNKGPSNHNRGAAVDVALIDAQGNLVEMPSPVDTFNITARRILPNIYQCEKESQEYQAILAQYPDILSYPERSDAAQKNCDYLYGIMTSCGFTALSTEWWHFTDRNAKQYPWTDYDLTKIPMKVYTE